MNKRIGKRVAAMTLAMLMAGLSMTGCNPKETPSSTPPSTASSGTPSKEDPHKDPVTLKWFISQDATQPDEDKVFAELNKYVKEKLNVTIDQVIYKNPDYNEKVPVAISSGSDWDICFTAPWGNKFLPNVDKDAYADLTELLPKYAKETKDAVPQMLWDTATVNGKIYAVPAYKEMGAQPGLMINSDLAKQAGVDVSKVKSMADLEPILKVVKEKLPGVIPFANSQFNLTMAYEAIAGATMPAAMKVDGFDDFKDQGAGKVFNIYDTQEFKDYCNLMYNWKKLGYLPDDPVTYDTDNAGRDRDDGANKLFSWVISYAPGYKDTRAASIGHGVDYVPLRAPLLSGAGGMMAISNLSKNKERALEFLNLVNTDEYVGTLLRHGIKGTHYEEVDVDGTTMLDPFATGFTAKDHPYNIAFGWQYGSVFNQKWVNSYPADVAKQFEDYNASAVKAPHLGFALDLANIGTEQAALSNVVEEFLGPLTKGMSDPNTGIPKFIEALKQNGVEKFITEAQKQIDAWDAAK